MGMSTELQKARNSVPLIEEATRRAIHARAAESKMKTERAARKNRYPLLSAGSPARFIGAGYRYVAFRVRSDLGPARDGSRKIVLERADERRKGETVTVRRDRVSEPG